MLQIKDICKEYRTGELVQKALNKVSLNLRDNEFVAILGPSGSGKTTLLNIIGGLDRYDSGNLIINGISTKNYKDRDWDSYRNHTIGFVFQSYNLIPHQTILSNVELALTISGISKAERRQRAQHALEQVGLGDQVHKKPNQLSGGQMQRVAIARALVNDPDILLADEPTGALDSDTSVQVMELLKDVARDRLVVMVTHNPELAEEYANRIVKLRDGEIRSDTNPFIVDEVGREAPQHKNMGKTSMSLLTSLALSFNNLKTKKGRTILTAFAGSIGIIGIALILSLSTGVNDYIKTVEEDTLSEYPLQIQKAGYDMSSMLTENMESVQSDGVDGEKNSEESGTEKADIQVVNMLTGMFSTVGSNDLESLKQYLESGKTDIDKHTKAIEYSYNIAPQIYSADTEKVRQVHPDQSYSALGFGSGNSSNSMMSMMMSTDVFFQMPANENLYRGQYDVEAGRWPKAYNECVLVLTPNGGIGDFMLYTLGLREPEELDKMVDQFSREEEVDIPEIMEDYSYEDILNTEFKLVSSTDYYTYDETYDLWKDKTDDSTYMKNLVRNGEDVKIVGIVKAREDATAAMLMPGIYYTPKLVDHVIDQAADSQIVKDQIKTPERNVFTGKSFDAAEDGESGFDMQSLITVDEEKLQSAFSVDESKLNMDLGAFNDLMGQISLPPLDIGDIISRLDVTLSPEQIETLIGDLMEGYTDYVENRPEADFSQIGQHLMNYLQSSEAAQKLNAAIEEAIQNNGEISLTPEQMEEILYDVLNGFEAYAKEHNLPDVSRFGEYLGDYLQSDGAKSIVADSLSEIVASSGLESQISQIMEEYMGSAAGTIGSALEQQMSGAAEQFGSAVAGAFSFDPAVFGEAIQMNMTEQDLSELMASMMSREVYTYEDNLRKLGYAEEESPSAISIYPIDFESKEAVLNILDGYNEDMEKSGEEDKVITYTDLVGTLMSSVTDIINVISYVLIAFVAISLVVSSIMIGVITYISVLERKKEIGILRAIGASKRNISQVFNAETFIIGLLAGAIGIGVTLLLLIPANAVIHAIAGQNNINAVLPVAGGVILVVLSVLLTLIGGIIPSRKAAREDPVTALRTE